jgi:hypothetical protein
MKYISMILADKIIKLLEDSGASESQKMAALQIARAVVPVSDGSSCSTSDDVALPTGGIL